MNTQTERTEAFIAFNHRPLYVPSCAAPDIYAQRVGALQAHARGLALRLDAVMELADAFLNDGMRDEFRKITSGEYTATVAKTDNN